MPSTGATRYSPIYSSRTVDLLPLLSCLCACYTLAPSTLYSTVPTNSNFSTLICFDQSRKNLLIDWIPGINATTLALHKIGSPSHFCIRIPRQRRYALSTDTDTRTPPSGDPGYPWFEFTLRFFFSFFVEPRAPKRRSWPTTSSYQPAMTPNVRINYQILTDW